jgi:hypothetical protein
MNTLSIHSAKEEKATKAAVTTERTVTIVPPYENRFPHRDQIYSKPLKQPYKGNNNKTKTKFNPSTSKKRSHDGEPTATKPSTGSHKNINEKKEKPPLQDLEVPYQTQFKGYSLVSAFLAMIFPVI